jgi:hypothetical protein
MPMCMLYGHNASPHTHVGAHIHTPPVSSHPHTLLLSHHIHALSSSLILRPCATRARPIRYWGKKMHLSPSPEASTTATPHPPSLDHDHEGHMTHACILPPVPHNPCISRWKRRKPQLVHTLSTPCQHLVNTLSTPCNARPWPRSVRLKGQRSKAPAHLPLPPICWALARPPHFLPRFFEASFSSTSSRGARICAHTRIRQRVSDTTPHSLLYAQRSDTAPQCSHKRVSYTTPRSCRRRA